MIRDNPNVSHQPNALDASVLGHVEMHEEFDPASFTYDQHFGGFVQPQDDGSVRLLMFRAEQADITAPTSARQAKQDRLIPKVNDTFYGTGLYTGNTPEAVSLYAWKSDRMVQALLTPPIRLTEVAEGREDSVVRRVASHAVKSVTMRVFKDNVLKTIDADYGDAKLAILNMGPDARTLQSVLGRRHSHSVKPVWYVWRSTENLEVVGAATSPVVTPNMLGRLALSTRK